MTETVARAERMLLLAVACLAAGRNLPGQSMTPEALRAKLHEYRSAHDVAIVSELSRFLAIPNLASDKVNIRRNAEHLLGMMTTRGIAARLLESPSGAPPAVYGELRAPGATKTVVFYAHYDGQPVDTTQWTTPPWQPVLRDKAADAGGQIIPIPSAPGSIQGEWRMYARSASDDKSPALAMLVASTRSKQQVSRCRSISSSSSKARRKPGRATCASCWKRTSSSSRPTRGCSATARCTSRAGSRSCSECAESRASSSRRTARRRAAQRSLWKLGAESNHVARQLHREHAE